MRDRSSSLSSMIRQEAMRLGFFQLGITPSRPLPEPGRFVSWVKEGLHGEMGYMERQSPKRLNPDLVFAGVRSLLVAGMNYYTGEMPTGRLLKGRISRYAWGDDYHSIVKRRLEQLLDFIQIHEPSARGLCYVDTGPIMEKVWASHTGLGWMGKHTNLITRTLGSWFFLGIILLNLELEYDVPEKDFCGTCRRCIDACPTGAIVAPYKLDARLCISYLTIEHRGAIPHQLRPLIGNRIYGCDDCQEACPWNRFAFRSSEPGFRAREGNYMPELAALVQITPEEFKSSFRNSPIWRATRDGFVRNVVVALGNSGSAEAIPPLERALSDPSPLVRSHAEWALERIRFRPDSSNISLKTR